MLQFMVSYIWQIPNFVSMSVTVCDNVRKNTLLSFKFCCEIISLYFSTECCFCTGRNKRGDVRVMMIVVVVVMMMMTTMPFHLNSPPQVCDLQHSPDPQRPYRSVASSCHPGDHQRCGSVQTRRQNQMTTVPMCERRNEIRMIIMSMYSNSFRDFYFNFIRL